MRVRIFLLGACAVLLASPGFAQTRAANPMQGLTRFTGTVQAVDGRKLTLKDDDGTTATAQLAASAPIMTGRAGTLADLGAGKFVGCTAVKGDDGKLHATECHIFPESMRGAGEGHYPMGPPNTTMTNGNVVTMTNGNVQAATGGAAGAVLRVSYQGGVQDIEVSPKTHIRVIMTGDASLLKPGMKISGAVRKAPDGTEVIQMLNVGP